MFECSKTYKFEYAHQLFTSYTNLCHETIHGHSGKVRITFRNNANCTVNKDNMVIDFGLISDRIKDTLMSKYDHALFIPRDFPKEYIEMLKKYNKRLTVTDANPTAEQFAMDICLLVGNILNTDKELAGFIYVSKVEFWETDSGCAVYEPRML